MANGTTLDLADEIKRKKAEDALASDDLASAMDASGDDEDQAETSAADDQQPIPAGKKGGYDYELIPESDITGKKPPPSVYPTVSEDQSGAPAPATLSVTPTPPPQAQTSLVIPTPTPESASGPTNLRTDTETGGRYVIDASTGQSIPYAEAATAQDKESQPPDATLLPKATVTGTAPAPDKLDQVERGELVGLPWPRGRTPAPVVQPAPDTLNQVERAQLVKLPTGQPAPDKLNQVEKAQPVEPATYPTIAEDQGAPLPPPKPAQKPAASTVAAEPSELLGMPIRGRTPAPPVPGPAPTPSPTPSSEPAELPMNAPNGKPPLALIIHHTSGNNSAESVVNDWRTNRPGVGAQMIVDRDGTVHYTQKEFGYNGTGNFLHSVIPGISNSTSVGIEVVAKNDADMTPAELQSLQRLAGPNGPYANVPVYGHSQVSPGDRDNEGVRGVAAINEARAGHPISASTDDSSGYVQGRATTFGYKDKGDPGVGAPRLGTIQTNDPDLVGIAIPEAALRQQLGANPALWRTARVDVVTPDGRHLLVPIVDLGPKDTTAQRGVAADFTQKLHVLTGNTGEETYGFKIVPNAGPDVEKNPQDFIAEQKLLMTGADTRPQVKTADGSAGGRQFELVPEAQVTPAAKTQAEQNTVADSAQKLIEKYQDKDYQNLGAVYRDVDTNTDIPVQVRENFKLGLQAQMVEQMIQYDGDLKKLSDSGPDGLAQAQKLAWAKWHNEKGEVIAPAGWSMNPNAVDGLNADSVKDLWSKIQGVSGQFTAALRGDAIENERDVLRRFFQYSGADTDQKKQDILTKLHSLPPDQQFNFVQKLLPQDTGIFNVPYGMDVIQSANRLSDDNWMQAHKDEHAKALQIAANQLAGDPRMKATFGGGINNAVAAIVNMGEAGALGPGATFGFLAQAADQEHAKVKAEHPDWTDDQINQQAWKGAAINAFGQELGMKIFGGLLGPLAGSVANPVARRVANSVVSALGMGGVSVSASALTDLAEGKPINWRAVIEAGQQGAIVGGVGGLAHGVPPEATRPEAVPLPEARTEAAPEVRPPPLPVKTVDSPISTEWHGPAPRQLYPPPVEGDEHGPAAFAREGAFTPEELHAKIAELAQGNYSPEELRQEIEQLQPNPVLQPEISRGLAPAREPVNLAEQRLVAAHINGDEPAQVINPQPTTATVRSVEPHIYAVDPQGNEHVASITQSADGTYRVMMPKRGMFHDDSTVYSTEAEAQAAAREVFKNSNWKISSDPAAVPGSGGVTNGAGVPEPWISEIANRYVQDRVAAGELGTVEPGTGKTTEALLAQGLRMGPEQINQHMSDIMHGVGDPVAQTAAIRAEEARLAHLSHQASLASELDATNRAKQIEADNAVKNLTDFHNGPVAKLKQSWHRQGVAFQDRIPIDLSTYNGIRSEFIKQTGKTDVPEAAKLGMRNNAKRVRIANETWAAKMQELGAEIDREASRRVLPDHEQNRENIARRMRGEFPCPS